MPLLPKGCVGRVGWRSLRTLRLLVREAGVAHARSHVTLSGALVAKYLTTQSAVVFPHENAEETFATEAVRHVSVWHPVCHVHEF